MVLSAAAGKTEISYLFSWCSRIPFHCRQYAGGFFRTGRIWKYFKSNSRSLAFWTAMDEESAAFDRFIQEQTKETRQEWEKSAKHTELMLEELPYKYKEIGKERYARTGPCITFMKIMTDFAGN